MPKLTLTQKQQLNQLSDYLKHQANHYGGKDADVSHQLTRTAYAEAWTLLQTTLDHLTGRVGDPKLGICSLCGRTRPLTKMLNQGGICPRCIANINDKG